MRLPREVMIVLRRGAEVLVVHRSPRQGAYWHVIAGGLEPGETPAEAARRELEEETGLTADPGPARAVYDYPVAEAPEYAPDFPPGTEVIEITCFLVDVPAGWEPELDWEHDDHRWCSVEEARRLMRWEDAAAALAKLASQ